MNDTTRSLNLTDAERLSVRVTFDVNKFVAVAAAGFLIGTYSSKARLQADFARNKITGAKFDGIAQRKYLSNYGN